MNKKMTAVIVTLFFSLGFLFNQSTTYIFRANESIHEPLCAHSLYQRAGLFWPPMHLNAEFRKKMTELANFQQTYESSPEITVYFKLDTPENSIRSLVKVLEGTSVVRSVQYITNDEALEIYNEINQDNPLLLEMVTADILPESLLIEFNEPSSVQSVGEMLKANQFVDEVVYKEVYNTKCSL